ncbi:hypothetical protein GCM10009733_007040 [Nonomuraea maheshkhaliensis]|uniref:DUF4239 domain-containing protein n=1 Tax=Nonomuraea maheshkhaliensis TaxID=419590 RepID=A0ABP4QM20_9ACTN
MKVLATWWDGQQTSDLEVFGWKMLYYGRVGKALLLVAGLAVIFDLLDPKTVKSWGDTSKERAERALARSRHNRQAARLSRLRESVMADMMTITAAAHPIVTAATPPMIIGYSIVKATPERVPDGLDVTLDTYRCFHRELMGELPGKGDPDDPKEADRLRYKHVMKRVEAFLVNHLSSDDQAKLALSSKDGDNHAGARMQVVSVLWSLIRVIAFSLAVTLQRAKPFHIFRWIALGLFFVGSLVDLLAS